MPILSREYSSAIRPLPASNLLAGLWLALTGGVVLAALAGLPPGPARVTAVATAGILACLSIGRLARLEPPCDCVTINLSGATVTARGRTTVASFRSVSLLSPRGGWLVVRSHDGREWSLVVLPWRQRDAFRRFYVTWRWAPRDDAP